MAKDQKVTPGFLPISDSMARDLDSGKADNRALDDFFPDSVLQTMKDEQDAQKVVHAEDLVPISKAEANRRTTFNGDTMPDLPKTRRVIPAPYKRDRVVGGKHGKAWSERPARQIQRGDIVPGIGRVLQTEERVRYGTVAGVENVAVGVDVHVWGGDANHLVFDRDETVRVFR